MAMTSSINSLEGNNRMSSPLQRRLENVIFAALHTFGACIQTNTLDQDAGEINACGRLTVDFVRSIGPRLDADRIIEQDLMPSALCSVPFHLARLRHRKTSNEIVLPPDPPGTCLGMSQSWWFAVCAEPHCRSCLRQKTAVNAITE